MNFQNKFVYDYLEGIPGGFSVEQYDNKYNNNNKLGFLQSNQWRNF